jgi:MFS family permease
LPGWGDALRQREFAGLLAADLTSTLGDQLGKVAVLVLLTRQTGTPVAGGLALAGAYLPWVVGGPFLTGLADRFPRRSVLVACDLVRAALVAVLAVATLPAVVVVVLLFAVGFGGPPFRAARSATLPLVLPADQLAVGVGLMQASSGVAEVAGFGVAGAVVGLAGPRASLAIDALTFALSAVLARVVLRGRPAPAGVARRRWTSTSVMSARCVLSDPVMRRALGLACLAAAAGVAPEGVILGLAHERGLGTGGAGALLAVQGAAALIGSILVTRCVREASYPYLLAPLSGMCVVSMASVMAKPPTAVLFVLFALAGLGLALQGPANVTFVRRPTDSTRAGAIGVAMTCLYGAQGLALTLAAGLARLVGPDVAVGAVGTAMAVALGWAVAAGHARGRLVGIRPRTSFVLHEGR